MTIFVLTASPLHGIFCMAYANSPCAAACQYMMPYNLILLLQIFSISNNSTLFKQAYPKCWSKFTDCNVVSCHIQHAIIWSAFTFPIVSPASLSVQSSSAWHRPTLQWWFVSEIWKIRSSCLTEPATAHIIKLQRLISVPVICRPGHRQPHIFS